MVTLTKDVTVDAALCFHPDPDEGFFVKSITIPDGITMTLTENGSLETIHTFENGFAIAQFYLLGGTLDAADGRFEENLNICFNAGTLHVPDCGVPESVDICRYIYAEGAGADEIEAAFVAEGLRAICIQVDCTLDHPITLPDHLEMRVDAIITVEDGASLDGNIQLEPSSEEEFTAGFHLIGSGRVNDWTNFESSAAKDFLWNGLGGHLEEEFDAEGTTTFKQVYNQANETTYRFILFGPGMYLEVHCSNYQYGEDGSWQYDYDCIIVGEHRVGTEGFIGTGENMTSVFNEYVLDDGTRQREDYYAAEEYFFSRYDPEGTLIQCGTRGTFGDELLTWDILNDDRLVLPGDTQTIEADAFKDVAAAIIVLPAGVTTIEDGAFSRNVLILVPNEAPIIGRLDELGIFNVVY